MHKGVIEQMLIPFHLNEERVRVDGRLSPLPTWVPVVKSNSIIISSFNHCVIRSHRMASPLVGLSNIEIWLLSSEKFITAK